MERRYLVAALAMIATFAGFSHGFRSLQRFSSGQSQPLAANLRCWAGSWAHGRAEMRAQMTHQYSPERAQLLAEMNIPMPDMAAELSRQLSSESAAATDRCDKAVRERERVRRDMMRMEQHLMRVQMSPMPVAISVPVDLQQQIQQSAIAKASRIARQVQVDLAADGPMEIQIPSVDVGDNMKVLPKTRCRIKTVR